MSGDLDGDRVAGALDRGTRAWPVELHEGPVSLRPMRVRDRARWTAVREADAAWLRPWEATVPPGVPGVEPAPPTFAQMVRRGRAEAREGRLLPFAVCLDGALVGQLTVGGVARGALRGGHIGYWVSRSVAGRGVIPTAVALAVDHCFDVLGLHRLEINIRPENAASLRVVEKLGLRQEGLRPRYLHIDGDWRDHVTYVVTPEEVPGGLLARWRAARGPAG